MGTQWPAAAAVQLPIQGMAFVIENPAPPKTLAPAAVPAGFIEG